MRKLRWLKRLYYDFNLFIDGRSQGFKWRLFRHRGREYRCLLHNNVRFYSTRDADLDVTCGDAVPDLPSHQNDVSGSEPLRLRWEFATPGDVHAKLDFVAPTSNINIRFVAPGRKQILEIREEQEVVIRDGRNERSDLTLNTAGFQLIDQCIKGE
jgi:hypothetical protein